MSHDPFRVWGKAGKRKWLSLPVTLFNSRLEKKSGLSKVQPAVCPHTFLYVYLSLISIQPPHPALLLVLCKQA